jgi:hypothetical protein
MKKIVFLHIQKTAGTTLLQILFNNRRGFISLNYENGKTFSLAVLTKLQKMYPFTITGIGGHHINCLSKNAYFGDEQFTFTILRDPIARYLSFYNHMILKHGYTYSFDDYLGYNNRCNFQTWAIGGTGKADDAIRVLERNFDFVGVVEQMEKTMSILSHELALDIRQKKLNTMRGQGLTLEDLTAEQLSLAKQNNDEDYKLYSYAVTRLANVETSKPVIHVNPVRKYVGVALRKVSLAWVNKGVLR